MMPKRPIAAIAALLLCLVVSPAHAADAPAWPAGELSAHVQAWFAQLSGDEAQARRFLLEHMAPAALADAPLEERLRRRAALLQRSGGLTPLAVVSAGPSRLALAARDGHGEDVRVVFEGEADPPHRLLGVRIEAGERGDGPRVPQGPPLTPAAAVPELRATLDRLDSAGVFSGVTLLARGGQTLLIEARGLADRPRGTAISPDTRFNLASIGKLFTRAALAQLAQQGKLSLDDKLSRFLPDFPHADSITLDMLAGHRSGVGDIFNPAYDAMDKSRLRHNRDYLALIRDQPLWFAPGTAERYSNGGYVLLGEVIARASGEDYYEYLARHVFGPAGMRHTGAPLEGDGTPGLARGYTRKGAAPGGETDNQPTRPARGSAAGGLYGSAADLLAFDRALLSGRLCEPAWAAWVTEGERPDRGRAPAGPVGFGFAGGAPGASTEWMHEGDDVLIVLTNRDPEVSAPVIRQLRGIVRRMQAAAPGARP